ncbi:General transcription factor IIH subunit 2 [Gurleya vavrai]
MSVYSWEEKYKRTWESPNQILEKQNFLFYEHKKNTKKALIRHLHISVDKSESIDQNDFLPSFRIITKQKLDLFIAKFKSENPISTFTLHIQSNDNSDLEKPGNGSFSLFSILENSYKIIKESSYIKEILVCCYSICIKDPFDVELILSKLIKNSITVSIISFNGEVKAMQDVCKKTGGKFYVPLNADHFESIINTFLTPKSVINSTVNLLKIGFPKKIKNVLCLCHQKICENAYLCAVCDSVICDLPVECAICKCLNVSSINLTKIFIIFNFWISLKFTAKEIAVFVMKR